jgi:Uncharacterized protein conserved in bacteria (DUF2272)
MPTSQTAWSAAFISWVMREAGVNFPVSDAHARYAQAIRESLNTNSPYFFEVLNPKEKRTNLVGIEERPVEVGDIIVKNRISPETKIKNNNTFQTRVWAGETHGDIVVDVKLRAKGVGVTVLEVTTVGGNLPDKVLVERFELGYYRGSYATLPNDYFVILRPKGRQRNIVNTAVQEAGIWSSAGWVETSPGGKERLALYWRVLGLPFDARDPENFSVPASAPDTAPKTGISPYLASFESFHPNIQYELTRRRLSTETANTYIPFVKLTSLMNIDRTNLSGTTEAWCPTLGIHGQSTETFENIYFPQNNKSIIAYATTIQNQLPVRVPVIVDETTQDQKNIPVPGIVGITTERNTAGPMGVRGGLFRANIKLVAYSVGQVDALLRYFLRPATRVVLELGRMASNSSETTITPYNWSAQKSVIISQFKALISDQEAQKQFINNYIYKNYGNYEIFIGYVAKFNLKYTKNNTYEIDLTVHSVQQFEIPTKHTGLKSLCATESTPKCSVMDIQQYFDPTYSWMDNSFSSLMREALSDSEFATTWRNHVIPLNDPVSEGGNNRLSGTNSRNAGTGKGGYLVSWKFFVDIILNDRKRGLLSIFSFNENTDPDELSKKLIETGFIRPVDDLSSLDTSNLVANEVGYHRYLRSVNPGIMLIYNPKAVNETQERALQSVAENERIELGLTDVANQIKLKSEAIGVFSNLVDPNASSGASLLTRGVWLNTNAIVQAFTSTDTVSSAVSMLLNNMNLATEGYWNLQLLSADKKNPGVHVIDMGLSKTNTQTATPILSGPSPEDSLTNRTQVIDSSYGNVETGRPKYTYVFNRKNKVLTNDDLGSELLDLNVEFNLPNVVAIQAIAGVGGAAQKSTLQAINIPELQRLSLLPELYSTCPPSASQDGLVCLNDPVLQLESAIYQGYVTPRQYNPSFPSDATYVAAPTIDNNERNRILGNALSIQNPNLVGLIREYGHLGSALYYIELNPSDMMKKLNLDSRDAESGLPTSSNPHAFNSSNLTKSVIDLTLPGIGGIELWQTFLVDRIPSILNKGYYTVVGVSHDFSVDRGWTTKLQGRFRYKPT